MNHWRDQNYKNEQTETEYLNNIREKRIWKVNNSFSELEKDLKELKDRTLRDRKIRIKKEIEDRKVIF